MKKTSFSLMAAGILVLGLVAGGCGDDDVAPPGTDGGVATDAGGGSGDGGARVDGAVAMDAGGGGSDGAVAVDAGGGGGDGGGGSGDAGGGGGGDAGYVCYDPGSSFPTFDKGCSATANCSLVFHQFDCCGGHQGIGINHAGRTAFDAAEAAHRAMCPATCDCVARTIDEAGAMSATGEAGVGVSCVGGMCVAAVL